MYIYRERERERKRERERERERESDRERPTRAPIPRTRSHALGRMRGTVLEPLTSRPASGRSDQLTPVAEGTRADATNDGPTSPLPRSLATPVAAPTPASECSEGAPSIGARSCGRPTWKPKGPCPGNCNSPLGSQLDTSSDAPAPELVEVLLSAWQHPCFPVLPVLPVSFPF